MASPRRILFISLAVPFPPTNGHRMRNWELLRALRAEGHDISLVSFADPHDLATNGHPLSTLCQSVTLVPLASPSGSSEYWSRLRSLLSPLPHGVHRFRSETLTMVLRQHLEGEPFHAVICDDIYMARNVPRPLSLPLLLNKHDLTHVIMHRYLAFERNPVRAAYARVEYWKTKRWETRVCSGVTAVMACSERDRDVLTRIAKHARILIVPNVIDVDQYAPEATDDGRTVLYFGAMDWYPNRDAVDFFVSAVLPSVRRQIPSVRFVVAGRGASDAFRTRFASIPGVEFTGPVSDMRAEIARATVCVVPLRIGSGTRLKIIEAAAMGKPIVSTSLGAEGLDFVHGEEIVLADQPQAFSAEVARLLADGTRRATLGRAARRRAENQYSLHVLRLHVRKALEELGL